MNKTVNINLGGLIFHIDEDAYLKLTRYFDAIKRSLNNSSEQDEIIKDIEMRVAELFTAKQTSNKQVVGLKEVDEIITVMGQPEDYIIEDNNQPNSNNYSSSYSSSKKLYRDKDGGKLGGIASGLGYYFGIDTVWIRVILVLLVVGGFGTGIIAYLVLWIVMPEAQTTSEKLEMKGEPVNISNIEKKVREEFDTVTNKFKNVDYDKYGNQFKSSANKIGNNFSDLLITIFKFIAKFIGIILIVSGLAMIIIFLIGALTLGTVHFSDFPFHQFIASGNFTDYPIWAFSALFFIAIAIPNFFVILLGFKLVSPNFKSIGSITKYILLAVWIIAIAVLISIGLKQASAFSFDGRVVTKQELHLNLTDTLKIKFIHNLDYAKSIEDKTDFKVSQDSIGKDIIYSNQVRFRIESTDAKTAYLQIEKEARGSSLSDAKLRAEQIRYHYSIKNNQLILDNYLITNIKNKFRDQEIKITVYLPTNTLFKVDASAQDYNHSNDTFFDLNYDSDTYIYKVFESKVKCLDCPNNFDEEDDDFYDSKQNKEDIKSITINKDGITIHKDTLTNSKRNSDELRINSDGIIIKTK
ncbi:PspC domain-containing protein [Flavobacterium sp. 7A]|uniref:PspC domain-containing protein n=1 Tax=Flavobacterium sp. 7A TaxID=2940571 RepID=UPI002226711D|nr:PspC domain-containing protein [Flavobacterium sp. 7A]MCW2119534.1 phage shock protein PspC (stress-responsive transcriptional regulator) [Flavobacterium sp. 7A]